METHRAAPKLLTKVLPVYPAEAAPHVQGDVVTDVTLKDDGSLQDVEVINAIRCLPMQRLMLCGVTRSEEQGGEQVRRGAYVRQAGEGALRLMPKITAAADFAGAAHLETRPTAPAAQGADRWAAQSAVLCRLLAACRAGPSQRYLWRGPR